jgi:organic hydroperoxide reductase OsmC/OhrA
VRQIPAGPDKVKATVEGDVGAVDRVLRITAIRVRYELTVPRGKREAAERAVETHEQKCPAATTSVRGCIPIAIGQHRGGVELR